MKLSTVHLIAWLLLLCLPTEAFIATRTRQYVDQIASRPGTPSSQRLENISRRRLLYSFFGSSQDQEFEADDGFNELDEIPSANTAGVTDRKTSKKMRQRISSLAKDIVIRPLVSAAPMPRAIASILKEATIGAVDMAVDEVLHRRAKVAGFVDVTQLVNEAFLPVEESLQEMEESLAKARESLSNAKAQATQAIEAVQAAAVAQAEGAATAVAAAEEVAAQKVMADIFDAEEVDISSLTYDDVGYHLSEEMSAPFIDENQCLVPGEAVVRVEKAPDNSRRIFAGIDIPVSVEAVWKILTDYKNLQKVVPNLTVNEVLMEYDGKPPDKVIVDSSLSDEEQCESMSKQLKGALLKQVGGAKVAGINFSARTTLEVREWHQGMPDFAHFEDEVYAGKSRDARALDNAKVPLQRYRFPRPFALSKLPTKDISMQSIENDDGEFRLYQGVWRMQPLPGCAPVGEQAMRLSYAVEVSPRKYLPVSLVEGRIVKDLCTNLAAIRDYVIESVPEEAAVSS